MFKKWRTKVTQWKIKRKQRRCIHSFRAITAEKCIGYTVSWIWTIVKEYEQSFKCTKCGKVEVRQYVYPGGLGK